MNLFLKSLANKRVVFYNTVRLPKNRVQSDVKIDTSVGDKYFTDTYRFGDGFIGLVSDIEVAKDPKTPSILKEHIQHIGAHAVHVQHDVASMMENFDQVLDGIVPKTLQTPMELQTYIDNG